MNAQPGLRLCCSHATNSSQVFSQHVPPVMSKCIYCYEYVSDKKVKLKKCMFINMIYCVVMSVHVVLVIRVYRD